MCSPPFIQEYRKDEFAAADKQLESKKEQLDALELQLESITQNLDANGEKILEGVNEEEKNLLRRIIKSEGERDTV